jgi:integrase
VGLYRRFSGMYWMSYTVAGKQRHESTHTHDKKLAQKIMSIRMAEIAEGRWNLPASNPPHLNRDLSVLRRMLTLAARQRLIARNPFSEVELLEERKTRRRPHILSYEDQNKLMAVVTPHLRALIVLLTETGLRVNKEAFALKWTDLDFDNPQVIVRDSKTLAGRRSVPRGRFRLHARHQLDQSNDSLWLKNPLLGT